MNLIATITRIKETTRHTSPDGDVTLKAKEVAIQEQDDLFYLLRLDENGICLADTTHRSLDEARQQAEFEYELIWEDPFDDRDS